MRYYNSTVIRAGIYLLSAIMKWHEMEWNGMNYGREGIWTAIITPCHQLILIHQSLKKRSFLSMMRWIGLLNGPHSFFLLSFLDFTKFDEIKEKENKNELFMNNLIKYWKDLRKLVNETRRKWYFLWFYEIKNWIFWIKFKI